MKLHLCIIAALCALNLGCGSASDGSAAKLTPVKGKVVFQNKPVTAARIYFMPDAAKGNKGDIASSVLELDGSFTLRTNPKGEGVVPGAYKVIVNTSRRPEPELAKYREVTTTPLTITVTEEGKTDLIFDLK